MPFGMQRTIAQTEFVRVNLVDDHCPIRTRWLQPLPSNAYFGRRVWRCHDDPEPALRFRNVDEGAFVLDFP